MNIHICTLQVDGEVIVDGKKERKYNDIYVHSKLLLVDDVFFTLGSANVNARSMEGDSELNISCPSPDLTKQWRERLWEIHTKNSPEIELRDEFRRWGDEMASNEIFTKKVTSFLVRSLVFMIQMIGHGGAGLRKSIIFGIAINHARIRKQGKLSGKKPHGQRS